MTTTTLALDELWGALLPLYDPMPELPVVLKAGPRNGLILREVSFALPTPEIWVGARPESERKTPRGNPRPKLMVCYRLERLDEDSHFWIYVFDPGRRP